MREAIKILLVDDHQIFSQALQHLLTAEPGLQIVGTAGDAETALAMVRKHVPQLVVMDLHLPGRDGIETTRQILAELPATRVIMLSSDPDPRIVQAALRAGATGYLIKANSTAELVRAIHSVMDHRLYLCPELASEVIRDFMRVMPAMTTPARLVLTDRERQLLKLVAEGRRSKEIAEILSVGVKSVETYRARLMKKLGCANSAELVRYAIREGVIEA